MNYRFFPAPIAGLTLISALLAPVAPYAARGEEVKQHIDVGKLPQQATLVDDVIVPVPSEVFGVLDKLGSPNWHDVLRSANSTPPGPRAETALLLGDVIAEGFIAVEAQEPEQVKKIGRTVLDLASALGVRKAVASRSSAIIEYADKKDWPNVRKELDEALTDVRNAMDELHDEDLAQLVSLGGWLRGTEALAQVVKRNYSKDSAGLLHQPALLDYFDKRISHMPPRLRNDATVVNIQKRLKEIRPLIGEADTDISQQSVDQIREIVHNLVITIAPANS
ncbi:MAG TPA: hypothetical protein VHY22_14865 [Chthoniobacteraceae bacterium]|jgi:hypothetical protein|nr:hypothetical protein [Chthoniobacteraceae bacterium]